MTTPTARTSGRIVGKSRDPHPPVTVMVRVAVWRGSRLAEVAAVAEIAVVAHLVVETAGAAFVAGVVHVGVDDVAGVPFIAVGDGVALDADLLAGHGHLDGLVVGDHVAAEADLAGAPVAAEIPILAAGIAVVAAVRGGTAEVAALVGVVAVDGSVVIGLERRLPVEGLGALGVAHVDVALVRAAVEFFGREIGVHVVRAVVDLARAGLAAVTEIAVAESAVQPPERVEELIVDRPFAVRIVDTGSDWVLFHGLIDDPGTDEDGDE